MLLSKRSLFFVDELDNGHFENPATPDSPTTPLSNTPDSCETLDTTSIGSNPDSGVLNCGDSGSHRSVRELVANMEVGGSDTEADLTRKGTSLPRDLRGECPVFTSIPMSSHVAVNTYVGNVSRSSSLRSPEVQEAHAAEEGTNHSPPSDLPSRSTSRGFKLKDRVKSLFNDASKELSSKSHAVDHKTKVLDF